MPEDPQSQIHIGRNARNSILQNLLGGIHFLSIAAQFFEHAAGTVHYEEHVHRPGLTFHAGAQEGRIGTALQQGALGADTQGGGLGAGLESGTIGGGTVGSAGAPGRYRHGHGDGGNDGSFIGRGRRLQPLSQTAVGSSQQEGH